MRIKQCTFFEFFSGAILKSALGCSSEAGANVGFFPGFIHMYIVVPCQSLDFGGGLTSVAPPLPSQCSRIYSVLDSLISRPLAEQSSDAKISRARN
jgi:hypothetical protein